MALSSGEHVGVVFNKEYCFDINEIQLSKKTHEAREIQTRISNERKWFEKTRICEIPSNLSRVLQISLEVMQFFISLINGIRKDTPITPLVELKVQSCKLYNDKYMISSTQITNTENFAFIAALDFMLLSRKVLFIHKKDNRNC